MTNKSLSFLASSFQNHLLRLAEDKITHELARQALKESEDDYLFSNLDENLKKDILVLLDRLLDEMKRKSSPNNLYQKYTNFINFFSQFKPENFSVEFLETFGGEDGDSNLSWIKTLEKKSEFDKKDLLRINGHIDLFEMFLDSELTFASLEQNQFLKSI